MGKLQETLPEKIEKSVLSDYPSIEKDVEEQIAYYEGKWGMKIPAWCAVPMGICADYVVMHDKITDVNTYKFCATVDLLTAVMSWRRNKIIYRFDESLAAELEPSMTEAIKPPMELLTHSPYPCVYIQGLPGLPEVDGAFFVLNYDPRSEIELYTVYCFKDGGVFCAYREMSDKTNGTPETEAGRWMIVDPEYTERAAKDGKYKDIAGRCLSKYLQHLNMYLYLCSDEPDIIRDAPMPKRRGEGMSRKATRSDVVSVGRYIGATLRKAAAETKATVCGTGERNVRPHMRRAHWSLYWTGKGRKVPRLKWLSPIFVNGNGHEAPVSLHAVE